MTLIVTYSNENRGPSACDVLVDGKKVGEQTGPRRSPEQLIRFFDVEYRIPAESVANKAKVTVRFEATNGRSTPSVFGVRIVLSDRVLAGDAVTDGLKWFQLVESESEVRKYLGQPAMVADFGEYRSWQYQIGEVEHDDFSHALDSANRTETLVSVSRTYNPERGVDSFFPPSKTTVHRFRAAGQPGFPVRLRRLPGGRVPSQWEHRSLDRPLDS
jgi:hypothetical protein